MQTTLCDSRRRVSPRTGVDFSAPGGAPRPSRHDNDRNDEPYRHGHALLRISAAGRAVEQKQARVHDVGLRAAQVSLPLSGVAKIG